MWFVAGPEPTIGARAGKIVFAILVLAWAGMLALIIGHPVFVAHDSVSNYAHVWYVQDRIWHGHGVPFEMPVLGHGEAYAFPYAFIPWITAALLWPLLGSWGVTLWLVLGSAGLIAATYWAFPELRGGWWGAAVLVNPALLAVPLHGELPFAWGMAMLMGAVACWRRGHHRQAAVLAGLGQATHPAVVLPIALLLVAGWLRFEPERRRLLGYYTASLLIVVPAAWLVITSPVVTDSPVSVVVSNFIGTVALRSLVLLVPIALVLLKRRDVLKRPATMAPWLPGSALAALIALNLALLGPLDTRHAFAGLLRGPDTELLAFIKSPKFAPGATYRVLRTGDGRIGMYQLERNGAKLDSEFFPESIEQRSWPSLSKYSAFLRTRHVDFVIVFRSYDREKRTNEHALLRGLARRGVNGCGTELVVSGLIESGRDFDVYKIVRRCKAPQRLRAQRN